MGTNVEFLQHYQPAGSGALHCHSLSALSQNEEEEMWQFKMKGPGEEIMRESRS